jgi:amino acid transporter
VETPFTIARNTHFAAAVLLYVPGGAWLGFADNPLYNGAVCLGILWFATLLNIVGLERAKWLQNAGAAATWLVGALVLCGGLLAWHRFGAATPIAAAVLVPDLRSLATLASFATMALCAPQLFGAILNPSTAKPVSNQYGMIGQC